MPHINVAMAASLRRGWVGARDMVGDVSNVKNSLSSWDNCMNAAYCKWPVIVGIVIGGLILLSIIACIVRCACCGMACCCSCFSCLKCCGDCCGCCDDPRGNKHKHLDEPYYPPQQGYHAPPPMMTGGIGGAYEPPKYAQFETGPTGHALEPKKVSDDALPPMPSWDTAAKKRILTEEEPGAVEMGKLDPATGQNVPLMTGAVPTSRTGSPSVSPVHSSYEDRPGANGRDGYVGAGTMATGASSAGAEAMAMNGQRNEADPYGRGGPNDRVGFNGAPNGRGYGPTGLPISPINDPSDRGGFNGAPNGRGYGPASQPISLINGPGRDQGFSDQFPQSQSYQYNPNGAGTGVAAGGAYGRPQPQRQFSSSDDSFRSFPPPQRQYSNDSNRSLLGPSPQRPYPDSAPVLFPAEPSPYPAPNRGPGRMASPVNNTPDFEFAPQPMNYGGNGRRPSASSQQGGRYAGSTAPPSYASRSPPPQQQQGGGGGYQGYQAYSAPQQGRELPSSVGRGREAQGWGVI